MTLQYRALLCLGRTAAACFTPRSTTIAVYVMTSASSLPLIGLSIALIAKMIANHYLLSLSPLALGYTVSTTGVLAGALAVAFAIGTSRFKNNQVWLPHLMRVGLAQQFLTLANLGLSIAFSVYLDEKADLWLIPLAIAIAGFGLFHLALVCCCDYLKLRQHKQMPKNDTRLRINIPHTPISEADEPATPYISGARSAFNSVRGLLSSSRNKREREILMTEMRPSGYGTAPAP